MFRDPVEWCKVGKKLTLGFKNGMRNFMDFYPTIQKSKNFISMSYFCPTYMRFELTNKELLSFMKLNSDSKFE